MNINEYGNLVMLLYVVVVVEVGAVVVVAVKVFGVPVDPQATYSI